MIFAIGLLTAATVPHKHENCYIKDPEILEDVRVELENWHLLQGKDTYLLHQLIQEFLREKQSKLPIGDKQKRNFCAAMAKITDKMNQDLTLKDINYFTPYIPHINEIVTLYQNCLDNQDLIGLFQVLGEFYESQGAYKKAMTWYEKSRSVARERLGEEHPDVAISLNNLALLYRNQGRYSEAEPLFVQSLRINKKLLGENHPDVTKSLNNLALLYGSQGRHSEAESLFLQALELYKKLREEYPDIVTSLSNLAGLYNSQERYSEAEPLFLQALQVGEKILGKEHPMTIHIMKNYRLVVK